MKSSDALRVIEDLRKGIPPTGYVEHFTVGRQSEIASLNDHLTSEGDKTALLLKANYGSGKSHLLKFIHERALGLGYAVSLVTLDAKSGVRFNRMDQIFGAILRAIELPVSGYERGVRGLLDFVSQNTEKYKNEKKRGYWAELTNKGKWDFSEVLDSEGLFVALRAWQTGDESAQETTVDWLLKPEQYRSQRKLLYTCLVEDLRKHFRDPRPERRFYMDDVFLFNTNAYRQSWDALADMFCLLKECGLKGLIILFDEFEDVLTNLNRVNYKEAAFWNLFLFFSGKRFPGMTFYAVTPAFVEKCKDILISAGRYDFDYERFDHLPTFEMSPLRARELEELAGRIIKTHARAYDYSDTEIDVGKINNLVSRCAKSPVQDRARHTIKEVVKHLDKHVDE